MYIYAERLQHYGVVASSFFVCFYPVLLVAMATFPLIDLPQEILGRVLSFLLPGDVARFGQTCRRASSFVSPDNQLLWVSLASL
jgi:hypothetical protein